MHGTLFCSTLVQEELCGLQVGEMLFSSCTASWTPPWAGSPTVSQALRPLQPLTKALTCGWAIHVPTHLVCMNVSLLYFVSLHNHVQQILCRDSCVMLQSRAMCVAVPALSVLLTAVSLYPQNNLTVTLLYPPEYNV